MVLVENFNENQSPAVVDSDTIAGELNIIYHVCGGESWKGY